MEIPCINKVIVSYLKVLKVTLYTRARPLYTGWKLRYKAGKAFENIDVRIIDGSLKYSLLPCTICYSAE